MWRGVEERGAAARVRSGYEHVGGASASNSRPGRGADIVEHRKDPDRWRQESRGQPSHSPGIRAGKGGLRVRRLGMAAGHRGPSPGLPWAGVQHSPSRVLGPRTVQSLHRGGLLPRHVQCPPLTSQGPPTPWTEAFQVPHPSQHLSPRPSFLSAAFPTNWHVIHSPPLPPFPLPQVPSSTTTGWCQSPLAAMPAPTPQHGPPGTPPALRERLSAHGLGRSSPAGALQTLFHCSDFAVTFSSFLV